MTDVSIEAAGEPAPMPPQDRFRRLGDIVIDRETRCVLRDGQATRLEPRVFALLIYLMDNPGREISRQELGTQVWNGVHVVDEAIQRAISVLRQALGDTPKQGLHIQTTQTGGYRLVSSVGGIPTQGFIQPLTNWKPLAVAAALGLVLGVSLMSLVGGGKDATPIAPRAVISQETPTPDAIAPEAPHAR